MPNEKMNIIYCTEVDNNGRVMSTSMIIPRNAHHFANQAAELLQTRKES